MLTPAVQEGALAFRHTERIALASQDLEKVVERLQQVGLKQQQQQQQHGVTEKEVVGDGDSMPQCKWDWASSYQSWHAWDDVEELRAQKASHEERLHSLQTRPDILGHFHDHSEERKVFELPEADKERHCERHRALGHALYEEGCLPKALEAFKLALAYFEYCFPESTAAQRTLDAVKLDCLCGVSLCYRRLGHNRLAIEAASQALLQQPLHAEALLRRAQARAALDLYDDAEADLRAATAGAALPEAEEEMARLTRQRARALEAETRMAKEMLLRGGSQQQQQQQCGEGEERPASVCVWVDVTVPLEPRAN